ncbi:MAG: cyclic nucleotide-binding domain-containing protein [Deltaproteobacteria bacterium]|nr:cyclic nucleotide-binding domain-containing protein [Deltaproteobacteria bacterium]
MLRKLGIEAGEGRIFVWSAVVLLLLGWSDATVQNVSEVLFNKRLDVVYLPLAYLASSLAMVATLVLFGRIADRSDRLQLLSRTLAVLGLALLPLWLLARAEVRAVYPLLVLASGQVTSLSLLAFFTAMGELLHARQAKRLFVLMMTGVTVGTILGNRASGPLGAWLGIEAVLPLSAAALCLGALVALPLRRLRPRFDRGPALRAAGRESAEQDRAEAGSFAVLWRKSLFFRLMFVVVLCSGMLGPMLYFQFQFVATHATAEGSGGAQELLAFYGEVKSWMYTGVLFVQLGVVRPLYRRFGVPLSAAFSPVIYLLGFLGLSVRLSLPVGVGAMAGTKLQGKAIYDPAVRVLYNLFPGDARARASALLDGPAKRGGGAIGNLIAMAATSLGSAHWVGYVAIPIALVWLLTAQLLWRRYPRLLLEASAGRSDHGSAVEDRELLDRATVRALVPEMCSADLAGARVAVDLVSEAEPEFAIDALAEAIGQAPAATRPLAVAALDRLLERAISDPRQSPAAARHLEQVLLQAGDLSDRDRADLVQAYARLLSGTSAVPLLERELGHPAPAVQLAARAALARCGVAVAGELDAALAEALHGGDAPARRTAREELRSLLLCERADPRWGARMALLTEAFAEPEGREEVAEALAEVAARHGEAASSAWEALEQARDAPDPTLRMSLLRFAGHAGLREQTSWLIEHLGSERGAWVAAAREGLLALGPLSSNALLRELAYGKRSKREGILSVMRELDLHPEALRALYEAELDAVERDLARLVALEERPAFSLLRRHLCERVREEQHTALLFLAAIRREDRIAELGERLRELSGRRHQHAIVVEALDAVLAEDDKRRLMQLIEEPEVEAVAQAVIWRLDVPDVEEAVRELLEDPEELTRRITSGLALAAGFDVPQDAAVDAVEVVKHLAALPLFERLTTRQLMDLSAVVQEHGFAAGATVVSKGDADDCLYLVVEGVVHITRGDTLLAELGPGDFFGEIALFEGVARTANAVTRTRVRLLGLGRRDLIRLLEELPGIAISLLETQSRRVRELTDRLMV